MQQDPRFIQERRRMYRIPKFLNLAANYFIRAVKEESFASNLPSSLLIVAKCLRRSGRDSEAMDWYLALAAMERQTLVCEGYSSYESLPRCRCTMMIPYWMKADEKIAELTEAGLVILVNHRATMLHVKAIMQEGFGLPGLRTQVGFHGKMDKRFGFTGSESGLALDYRFRGALA